MPTCSPWTALAVSPLPAALPWLALTRARPEGQRPFVSRHLVSNAARSLSVLYLRRCLAPNVALGDVLFLLAVWDIPCTIGRWGRSCLTSRLRTSPMTSWVVNLCGLWFCDLLKLKILYNCTLTNLRSILLPAKLNTIVLRDAKTPTYNGYR